jgi:hypothetical protein
MVCIRLCQCSNLDNPFGHWAQICRMNQSRDYTQNRVNFIGMTHRERINRYFESFEPITRDAISSRSNKPKTPPLLVLVIPEIAAAQVYTVRQSSSMDCRRQCMRWGLTPPQSFRKDCNRRMTQISRPSRECESPWMDNCDGKTLPRLQSVNTCGQSLQLVINHCSSPRYPGERRFWRRGRGRGRLAPKNPVS